MHDTAFQIGSLAMNIYADLRSDSILEVGSQAVNGSLRENALPTTRYVGIDIEAGEGVDLVAEPGKPFPVEDDGFDFVIATSVFEHDPCFWVTFLEMCRTAKDGGYIYISAPSNGFVHRFPQDNWRFYPDSGKALAHWAVSQGQPVTLVESFVANRETDVWNDFVAVFRKGRITKTLPKVFLHEHVKCSNIVTWKSKEIINPMDEPEDMLLLRESTARAQSAEESLFQAVQQRDALIEKTTLLSVQLASAEDLAQVRLAERDGLQARLVAAEQAQDELKVRESELCQRQEEIEQTRRELIQARSERDEMCTELAGAAQRTEVEAKLRQQAESALASWRELYERLQAETEQLSAVQERFVAGRNQLERRLKDSDEELARAREKRDAFERELRDRADELKRVLKDQHELERRLKASETESERVRDRFAADLLKTEEERASAQAAAGAAEGKLKERYQELATLANLLREQESHKDRALDHLDWLLALHDRLASQPRWWSLMPKSWRRQRQGERLKRSGVFNGAAYLERYRDVADARLDPLDHYLRHGMHEGRSRVA